MTDNPVDPLVTAVALSLYAYNVSPIKRATGIFNHFEGRCADVEELIRAILSIAPATELAAPSADVDTANALLFYGEEAARRVAANLPGRKMRDARAMESALRAVLLFYTTDEWTSEKAEIWKQLTGSDDATTASLCQAVRRALLE